MGFSVNADEIDPDKVHEGMGFVEPGSYHVMLESVKEADDEQSADLIFIVLAGTVEGMQLRKHKQRLFYYSSREDMKDLTNKTLAAYGLGLGLFTPDQVRSGRLEGDFASVVNAQAIIKIETREYTKDDGSVGKTSNIKGADIWHVDHPDVEAVPRDAEAMQMHRANNPLPANSASQPAQPAQSVPTANSQPQQQPVGAGASGGTNWDDI